MTEEETKVPVESEEGTTEETEEEGDEPVAA
jgi:hypothetical protein